MSKAPSPKSDALRAMREAEHAKASTPRAPISDVIKDIMAVPAKKQKRKAVPK